MSAYDKGFGGPGASSHGQRHRDEPTRHGAAAHPPHRHGEFGDHGPSEAPHGQPRVPGPRDRRWTRHTGRVAKALVALGLAGGVASLIAWNNWAAVFVLPVLLGVIGATVFWLVAAMADAVRRVR